VQGEQLAIVNLASISARSSSDRGRVDIVVPDLGIPPAMYVSICTVREKSARLKNAGSA